MDRDLQNAYSRQASVEVEQQLGRADHRQRRVSVPARTASAHVRQPERADLRRLGHQQRLPAEPELREQQSVLLGRRVQLSRPARLVHAAAGAMGQLPDLVHAVEVDEQRRRVLLQLADRPVRPLEGLGTLRRRPAASSGGQRRGAFVDGAGDDAVGAHQPRVSVERHAAGVLGAAVQHHVGRHDDPGHGRPADRRRRVHRAQCRDRQRLLQPERAGEPRVSRRGPRGARRRWPRRST